MIVRPLFRYYFPMQDMPSTTDTCRVCQRPFTVEELSTSNFVRMRDKYAHPLCYAPYVDETNLKILANCRCWSIGDTLTMTPAIRELRRLYPKAEIGVISNFPELFKYNPHVDKNFDRKEVLPSVLKPQFTRIIDLFTGDFQQHWATHSVDFCAKSGLGKSLLPKDMQLELSYSEADRRSLMDTIKIENNDKLILVHPHKTEWDTRNWGASRMPDLVRKLKAAYPSHRILSIGGSRFTEEHSKHMKNYVDLPEAENLYGRLSLLETAALMDLPQTKLLVTPDTGTLHLAATRPELPIVGIFTLIKSHFRAPYRRGSPNYKFYPVEINECSCTYDGKAFIEYTDLSTCPKGNFLITTLQSELSPEEKLVGLKQRFPETAWKPEELEEQIAAETQKYRSGDLRCFPEVQKVFDACKQALDDKRSWKLW